VLVVMLLLATPLAFEASIGVRNAGARAKKAKQEEKHELIQITVGSEDSVKVNRQIIPWQKLAVTLQPLLERSATRQVMLSCAGGVSHGTFVDVLDVAKYSGAEEIAVVGR